MKEDRIKWNRKHNGASGPGEPAAIIRDWFRLAPAGRALDIAAGTGGNALFLAEKGFEVHAVDISEVGLRQVAGLHPRIHPICADLDTFEIPEAFYSLIVCIRFLDRRIFPRIAAGLVTGGVLLFETFLSTPETVENRPRCADYLLKNEEMESLVAPLHIERLEKVMEPMPMVSMAARRLK